MKNLLALTDEISAKVLFIIAEDGRDEHYRRAADMWNMDVAIEHIPFQGYSRATKEQFDVVVVDDYLGEKSGYMLASEIMDRKDVMVMMLGRDMDDISVVGAYRMGIHDYLPVGVSPAQLAAKCIASVNMHRDSSRRVRSYADGRICAENLTLDTRTGILEVSGRQIQLVNLELAILKVLMENHDIVLSKKEIYEKAWGSIYIEGENSVAMHISRIRHKMEEGDNAPIYIETKWGGGYRFLSRPIRKGCA